ASPNQHQILGVRRDLETVRQLLECPGVVRAVAGGELHRSFGPGSGERVHVEALDELRALEAAVGLPVVLRLEAEFPVLTFYAPGVRDDERREDDRGRRITCVRAQGRDQPTREEHVPGSMDHRSLSICWAPGLRTHPGRYGRRSNSRMGGMSASNPVRRGSNRSSASTTACRARRWSSPDGFPPLCSAWITRSGSRSASTVWWKSPWIRSRIPDSSCARSSPDAPGQARRTSAGTSARP